MGKRGDCHTNRAFWAMVTTVQHEALSTAGAEVLSRAVELMSDWIDLFTHTLKDSQICYRGEA